MIVFSGSIPAQNIFQIFVSEGEPIGDPAELLIAQFGGSTREVGPVVSDDGEKIAWVHGSDGNVTGKIYMADLNGPDALQPKQLTDISGTEDTVGDWSPDGQSMVFTRGGLASIRIIEGTDVDFEDIVIGPEIAEGQLPDWGIFSDADLTIVSLDLTETIGTVLINPDGKMIQYTPDEGQTGFDQFDYTIKDSFGNTSTATVDILIG